MAFLPRHGKGHQYPPHGINYRANAWAMKQLGVTRIIGPCAAGSLQKQVKPGDFVVSDQGVDRTMGVRKDTFFDGPIVTHLPHANPYCPEMRAVAVKAARELGISVHDGGTVVTINGPRFSTKAESRWYSNQGWQVVSMTQFTENVVCRELNMCYVNVALITDYDAGLEDDPDIEPVTHEAVMKVFSQNVENMKKLVYALIEALPDERQHCGCGQLVNHVPFA